MVLSVMVDEVLKSVERRCRQLNVPRGEHLLLVSISKQRLYYYRLDANVWLLQRSYWVSTGRNPPSCIKDSLGTPLGLHRVCQKIGENSPPGTVFVGRVPSGKYYWEMNETREKKNLITSRILRLEGLEPGYNQGLDNSTQQCCDTLARYVYVHGTNLEHRIGKPGSDGCILLTNHDVIDLYNRVPKGSLVWIET